MAGRTRTRTYKPACFARFGSTRRFQSPVLHFGFYYLWSHSDMPLLISKYSHLYVTVSFWCMHCLNDQNNQRHTPYPILKMSINRASMIVGRDYWVIWGAMSCGQSYTKDWPPLLEIEKIKCSLPYLDNEHQWSIKNCWPCITVNHSVMWPLLFIYISLTVFVH